MSDVHGADLAGQLALEPLAGGWSGRTFLGTVAGERSVVRVYDADDAVSSGRDAAVLQLARQVLAGCAPVPAVLEVRHGDAAAGTPGLLVTEFLPGERGDLLLPALDERGLASFCAALGEVVARLAGAVQPVAGRFLDAGLAVGPWEEPWDSASLSELVSALVPRLDLAAEDVTGLLAACEEAQELLDAAPGTSLVHGDLNPKNLLLSRHEDGTVVVTGVLDWEFAHAGTPWADLGNLVRDHRLPAYVDALVGTVATRRGTTVEEALDRARAADLVALVELATRRGSNPVADAAHERVLAIARSRDLHAR